MERISLSQSTQSIEKTNLVVESIDYNNPYNFEKTHRHNYFELLLFETGEGGKQVIDFKKYTISSHMMYVILPGQIHLMKRLPNENGLLIQFTKDFLSQCIPKSINYFILAHRNPCLLLNDFEFDRFQNHFKQIQYFYKNKSQFQLDKLRSILALILFDFFDLASISKDAESPLNIAYKFIDAVENNFKTIKTVAEYEQILETPRKKITEIVKIQFGLSPLQIIHDTTILEIKRLLFVEELSHKEIAFELNFDSQSSYNRFVKKMTSLTPMQLKRSLTQIANQ